ncbi:MAG: (2Fe-2S)-binding protein [Chloroflexi bacterium]|uniref:(2Fe-2S)-binding protein n=1 Tax=Candidatus Chlorohelix allophototropha TaxID=3003348 RepID=A0A8T7M7K8_9CHLR|nr:(2Fe-2S)-binding protein [Chloroflexota bacterium]WJW68065.1 (2Fe-2S)-binding protein [Chloroflexota bacterium L227-S17]
MPIITILPSGQELEVEPGLTIMEAVLAKQLAWPTTCGGKARCTTCAFVLIKGFENVSPMSRLEEHQLAVRKGRHSLVQKLRLACQTRVKGDITIRKNLQEFC